MMPRTSRRRKVTHALATGPPYRCSRRSCFASRNSSSDSARATSAWGSWHTFCLSQVRKRWCVPLRYIQQGVRPMVSHLRVICLSLGILSTVMGCAATPPPMAPLRATLAPAAPAAVAPPAPPAPADAPPVVAPLPDKHPSSTTDTNRPDVYQSSPYER